MVSKRGDDDLYVFYGVDQQKRQLNIKVAIKLKGLIFVVGVNLLSTNSSDGRAEC